MLSAFSKPSKTWQRQRGSRFAGRMWVLTIYFCLLLMNCAAGLVVPLIGSLAPFYCGALWIALFWDTVLLAAIWFRHDWARFILAGFLICFDVGLLLFVSEASGRCPSLRGEGVNVLVLLSVTNALAAGFILGSIDIICISRPMSPKDN